MPIKLILVFSLPITADEAYYFIWGHFLSGGYYDHPPLIGWLLYLFQLLGAHPLSVRLPAVLLTPIVGCAIYAFLKREDAEKAALASCAFILSPISLWSVLIATDVPLLIFSFLSIVCVLQTLRSQNNAWCIAGGLCLGLAFLSKYFACLLAFSYGVYFLILSPGRASLKRLAILAAGALPFLIQNLYWNYQHGWPNLLFNLVNRNFFVTGLGYKNLLVYLLMLVYLVNPFFCWQLIRAFFSGLHGATMRSPYGPAAGSPPSLCDGDLLRPRRSPYCLRARSLCKLAEKCSRYKKSLSLRQPALCFLGLPLLCFLALSSVREIGLHWPLAFILPVFIWAGLDLDKEKLKGALRFTAWYGGLQTLVLMLAFLLPLNVWQKLPLSSSAWHRLVYFFKHREIHAFLKGDSQHTVLAAPSYSDASLMFNDLGLYTVVFGEGSYHGRQDDLLTDFRALNHRNFLIFYKRKPQLEAYQPYFRKSELHRFTQYGARFYYVSGKDFQYPLYRDRVLRIICLSYWRIPSWLPARGNFFSLKYFGNETCASGQSTGSSHTQAR
ncbi:Glycosyl transferase, family 39 [Candidatus Glomeribacter gigasporarum BEG34]|uniref:Glycosyl transferase, family 39 n=1 Tax=Candidatus Glomeribacter gigasporarum BEG34 TaxID=1070319 RepID=G2J7Y8_9BURK|nr:Glycosyl transferase, family 39 [Candidatus Glomeribacter gigasporarum BEG34]